ncbi:hypothetical protein ACVW2L_001461 [Mucilaginibacter sp. HD30]
MQPQSTNEKQQAIANQEMIKSDDIAAAVCYGWYKISDVMW